MQIRMRIWDWHYHPSIMEADRLGKSPYDCSPELVKEVKNIVQRMGGENL